MVSIEQYKLRPCTLQAYSEDGIGIGRMHSRPGVQIGLVFSVYILGLECRHDWYRPCTILAWSVDMIGIGRVQSRPGVQTGLIQLGEQILYLLLFTEFFQFLFEFKILLKFQFMLLAALKDELINDGDASYHFIDIKIHFWKFFNDSSLTFRNNAKRFNFRTRI